MSGQRPRVAMEFHVSRAARDRYSLDAALFSITGNVVAPDFAATRALAHHMNERRDLARHPELTIHAGQLNAMGLIDEILHYVSGLYREQRKASAVQEALAYLDARLGRPAVDATLLAFGETFPATAVYLGEVDAETYLAGSSGGTPHRQLVLEELLMLWLANANPAFAPFSELFDDTDLARETAYRDITVGLQDFFAVQPPFGPDAQPLVDMLRSPAAAVPDSLSGQLQYIRERWGLLLGRYLDRLIISLGVLEEEERAFWLRFHGPGGVPASTPVYEFGGLEAEPERYSLDRDWMPRLVLIAKSTYVWLDQLARTYGREVRRLDQIPDEELDRLARSGFSGLWLIGLWERSRASQRIKQLCGNPEAVASAYSLLDYRIADDLGGEAAYENLRERAGRRGIRLASDMVPNHMGIDSRWLMEHPDWFISLDEAPFPSYAFTGPDLSWDERVGLFVEDHYYDRSDAAVVFKRADRRSGEERYVYHGNDGTSTPWNDTAQLNYLRPDVREAVIQTILEVARRFPVIRFDAAMTLAKKHYQRLWFPEPGTGGAIPSRAEHGLTRRQFHAAMPVEFWREVVDRVAAEAPDTLLLAEAFWLMEGYFVRTLGMHRVYNSAFMNMLRDEKNADYRRVIKNTLEFDPEILKRYVNFMNNPDERTAVDQFGKGDKYFGICTLMATMPGLPMFGHGQIEGFAEKYGMEYRRGYHDEQPDRWLVERHEREIFPLLHRRHLFANVRDFLLYDFVTAEGHVNEDVFAYSNSMGGERSLVLYHNRYASTRGWVRLSAAYAAKGADGRRELVRRSLAQALDLHDEGHAFCLFRDRSSGLEFIRSNRELHQQGLYVEFDAYRCHVFLDFREVRDDSRGQYARLCERLAGSGVPSLEAARREMLLRPIHDAFRTLTGAEMLRRVMEAGAAHARGEERPETIVPILEDVQGGTRRLLQAAAEADGIARDADAIARGVSGRLAALVRLPGLRRRFPAPPSRRFQAATREARELLAGDPATWGVLVGRLIGAALIPPPSGVGGPRDDLLDVWQLGGIIAAGLRELDVDDAAAWRSVEAVRALLAIGDAGADLASWLENGAVRRFLRVNRHGGVVWFDKEAWERLVGWRFVLGLVAATAEPSRSAEDVVRVTIAAHRAALALRQAASDAGYRVDELLAKTRTRRKAGGAS